MNHEHQPLTAIAASEQLDETEANRAACLDVLAEAILLARFLLRQPSLSRDEQRELFWLMDAVHNLPAAASDHAFWTQERVVDALAGYDVRYGAPNQKRDQYPLRQSLCVVYRASREAHVGLRQSIREAQRELLQRSSGEPQA
jgi:hypothetical protein